MVQDLVLAIGIPIALLLVATAVLERWGGLLPPRLQQLSKRSSLIWNAGVGLIIALSLLRWLLQR
ncbi:hypothetical protein [Synechococcus sp. CS-205]|uniref:hypothetical protein n=1 Tax=Synechococcus sp. CS-205 TaxID=2847984 RepID=UPI00223AF06B|nr:hypothetical protein [Synechococcus sp. CS-205]MCT0247865.1 hypothetical protein [Synechococcus sp. CS-205]